MRSNKDFGNNMYPVYDGGNLYTITKLAKVQGYKLAVIILISLMNQLVN